MTGERIEELENKVKLLKSVTIEIMNIIAETATSSQILGLDEIARQANEAWKGEKKMEHKMLRKVEE